MKQNKITCDRCGKEELFAAHHSLPKFWVALRLRSYDMYHTDDSEKHLCQDCATALKIPQNYDEFNDTKKYKSVGDRLLEIMEELANGNQTN